MLPSIGATFDIAQEDVSKRLRPRPRCRTSQRSPSSTTSLSSTGPLRAASAAPSSAPSPSSTAVCNAVRLQPELHAWQDRSGFSPGRRRERKWQPLASFGWSMLTNTWAPMQPSTFGRLHSSPRCPHTLLLQPEPSRRPLHGRSCHRGSVVVALQRRYVSMACQSVFTV